MTKIVISGFFLLCFMSSSERTAAAAAFSSSSGVWRRSAGTRRSTAFFLAAEAPAATSDSTGITTSDFGSAMPKEPSPYEQIGIEEDGLALGVNPKEVYTYIGTRENLIEKTLADIPSFDRSKAEEEVDKFLLDAEMLKIYIQFQKMREDDPDFKVPDEVEEEGLFSFRNIVVAYLGYVGFTSGPTAFRRWVASKEAAGEWEGTNIPFIDEWIQNTAVPAVDGGDGAIDSVQGITDAAVGTAQNVAETLQSVDVVY